uniref:Uncharacterized protein n=1 Tax=Anguilla anguilla TaxID=7936 RepID=A0A0E9W365_ANGAN
MAYVSKYFTVSQIMGPRPPTANMVQKEATYSHNTKAGLCLYFFY